MILVPTLMSVAKGGDMLETVWFDELDKKYKCKDCYMFNTEYDCPTDGESCICGDFMTTEEYTTGVKLVRTRR